LLRTLAGSFFSLPITGKGIEFFLRAFGMGKDLLRSSGFNNQFGLGSIFVNFRAHRRGTISTEILILLPFG